MIRNYFKIALRNLLAHRVFSLINISGLALGITTCALISLYIFDEASYDKHHQDGDRVYRIASESKSEKWVAAPAPMAAALQEDFPEVEQVTRLLRMPGVDQFLLKNEQTKRQFFKTNGFYVDSTFFRIFTYNFKFGDHKTALDQPNSIVISEDVALQLFGSENPVEKSIMIGLPFGSGDYTVKGVFRNKGNKSHIPANLFLSMNNGDVGNWVKMQTKWNNNSIFHTYVKLKPHTDPGGFEAKLAGFLNRHGGADLRAVGISKILFIQSIKDIYLYSNFGFEIAPNGNIKYLYVFSAIAIFLLVIACVNFMNLSTARSEKRAKEVGVRKVVGASQTTLIGQFLGESLLLSFLALLLSLLAMQLLLPVFNGLTNKHLSFSDHPVIIAALFFLTLFTGLLSGMYPAFYLSSFTPITVLKGKLRSSFSVVLVRKGLVVFQFTISIILILGAILTGRQMKYMTSRNLGFNQNQKLVLPLQTIESGKNFEVLKTKLAAKAGIISSTKASTYPGIENVLDMLFYSEGKSSNENVDISTTFVDPDYIKTLGIETLQGRSFSREFTADSNAVVLNETAVRQLGYTVNNAVGKKIFYDFAGKRVDMNIIGVVRNYHFAGLQQEIKPLALTILPLFGGTNSYLILNIKTGDYATTIAEIEKLWKTINPDSPFTYSFLDKDFQKNYEKEERIFQLIAYFALIGIFIACLGLYGLAAFTAEQRTKEIGIRKVLGASTLGIAVLLSTDFMKLVVLALILASPVAWWAMKRWLSEFAYKTEISWQIFAVAGSLAVMIALFTISFQSIKSALMDPVKSLQTD